MDSYSISLTMSNKKVSEGKNEILMKRIDLSKSDSFKVVSFFLQLVKQLLVQNGQRWLNDDDDYDDQMISLDYIQMNYFK